VCETTIKIQSPAAEFIALFSLRYRTVYILQEPAPRHSRTQAIATFVGRVSGRLEHTFVPPRPANRQSGHTLVLLSKTPDAAFWTRQGARAPKNRVDLR